jgi:hypothetical protein
MKPGDLIEWAYNRNFLPVRKNEELWSTPMKRWIPIGVHPMMLISITDEFCYWLTPDGLFHARRDDTSAIADPMTMRAGCSICVWMT